MSAIGDAVDICELIERTASVDGDERWRARHRGLGIEVDLVRWRAVGADRDRLRGWLARRGRLAHPRLAPLIAAGEDGDACWGAVEAGAALTAHSGWRAAWSSIIALGEGLAALHGAGDALGDVAGASLRDAGAAPRLGLPTRAPGACDARADVAALAAFARRLLGAEREDWFLPPRVRSALAMATEGRCAHAGEFARACVAALAGDDVGPRRLLVVAVPTPDGVAVHAEEPGRGQATRHVPAATVAALADAWSALRASRPAAATARRALGDGDPAAALAVRFVAETLPEGIAARLWEPEWRVEIADAGTPLPWRLVAGAATPTRTDIRPVFGEGVPDDVVAPMAVVVARGAGAAAVCARATARAFARRAWWPRRAPQRGPLLLTGDLAAARALLAADAALRERVALAIVAGDGPALPLRDAAAQLVLDPAAPRTLWPAIAAACCATLAAGGSVADAADAADAVLRERSAACDPLVCGAVVHGAADLRVAMTGRVPVVR